jgi:ATP-dependent Clp protease ATP-binding subunit ClpB
MKSSTLKPNTASKWPTNIKRIQTKFVPITSILSTKHTSARHQPARWIAIGNINNPHSTSGSNSGQPPTWVDPAAVPPGESLKKYCIDLTALAKEGKLDPVIGRDEEMRRTIEILSRRTKNNPVLLGEPGVGKTA